MIRLLFVDDDENVLFAMRRAMHCMRHEWAMEFVMSGEAALASLAREPADVVVTDMRMPGMDGWQLLALVKERYPETVRLVLSGHAEPAAIMRLVGTAHQYIAKPAASETLKAAIAETQLMKSVLSNRRLAQLVGKVGTLPSFPQAFQDITQCLRQRNASVGDAAKIIERDVAMTANVMKMVNSAFFGSRRPIASVDRAVAYLGLDTLTTLALGHGLFQSDSSKGSEALWRHSLETAMAARAIALCEHLPPARLDEAFLTGMLHDVGRVVFAAAGGADHAKDPDIAATVDGLHAEAGAYLLGLWGFPSQIVAAVALHHHPGQGAAPGLDLTLVVHVADRLVRHPDTSAQTPEQLGIEPGLLEQLGMADRLPAWRAAVNSAASEKEAS